MGARAVQRDPRGRDPGARAAHLGCATHFTERPLIRRIDWEGESGLDLAELAAAAGLARRGGGRPRRASPRPSAISSRAIAGTDTSPPASRSGRRPWPGSSERDVTVVLERRRAGARRPGALPGGHRAAGRRRSTRRSSFARATATRSRSCGRARAPWRSGSARRATTRRASPRARPDWHADTNRVDLDFQVTAGPRFRVEFEGRARASRVRPHDRSSRSRRAARRTRSSRRRAPIRSRSRTASADTTSSAWRRTSRATATSASSASSSTKGRGSPSSRSTFTGNLAVPGDRLAKQIETRRPALFRRGLFRQDLLDHDVGVVLAYLRSLGYAEATVGPRRGPLLRGPDPGPRRDPGRARDRVSPSAP